MPFCMQCVLPGTVYKRYQQTVLSSHLKLFKCMQLHKDCRFMTKTCYVAYISWPFQVSEPQMEISFMTKAWSMP